MRVLGVDLGERRLGFSVSDPEQRIATPLRTHPIRSPAEAVAAVLDTASEVEATEIVVGYPRNLDGTVGTKAREAEAVVEALRARGAKVELWDERLTTAEADRALQEAGLSRRKRKAVVDAVAAQRILASFLAARQRADGEA